MATDTRRTQAGSVRRRIILAGAGALIATTGLTVGTLGATPVLALGVAPPLGTTANFAVVAGQTITNTGPTVIVGDLGLHPGSAVTGAPAVVGAEHVADGVALQAKNDLVTAYTVAKNEPPDSTLSNPELGGLTLVPGVYRLATAGLTGTLTLDGKGDPNSVFIFQVGSTLITGSDSRVRVINGASACNIFWQVGSSATLGTRTNFQGNILALTDITLTTGANIQNGRALVRNGQLVLDTNHITSPGDCSRAASSTGVTSSAPSSVTGQPVTLTATVPGASGGTVTFLNGTTSLGTSPVGGTGQATVTTTTLTAGSHSITAVYTGSSSLLGSTSPVLIQTVRAPTSVSELTSGGTGGNVPAISGPPSAGGAAPQRGGSPWTPATIAAALAGLAAALVAVNRRRTRRTGRQM
jgi:hypothetical protein